MTQIFMLAGRLGQAPEIRHTQAGTSVANMRLIQNRSYKKGGAVVEAIEGFNLVSFEQKLIEKVIVPYCKKGTRLRITGRLQSRSWEDRDGNTRYSTEVIISDLRILQRPNAASTSDKAAA